ncbi:thiamine pyrophosphokinase [Clostridia bacterium]|nr:thiamine pyrophosphokinase [Clostridia bacterium]
MQNTKVCHIFGGGDCNLTEFKSGDGDLTVAADGGLRHLARLGVTPDLLVGDFDSLDALPSGVETLRFPVEKDDTDMCLAAKEGLRRGYRVFKLYGGMGGERISHTLANIALLAWLCEQSAVGTLIDADTEITAVRDGEISLNGEGHVSIFAHGGNAQGVSVKGMKYNASGITLEPNVPLGVSNTLRGNGLVSVERGTLIVVHEKALDSVVKT